MYIFQRRIQPYIEKVLFKGNIITILGPRQAGKTTLAKNILSSQSSGGYFDCQLAEVRDCFIPGVPKKIKELIGEKTIVVFDEAQTIQDIGSILKVFHDTYPAIQVIATGSSSFDLANKINEPMTGRVFEFILLPLSIEEIKKSKLLLETDVHTLMQYGMYPAVVGAESTEERDLILKNLVTNYLYKDVFVFESIRNPRVFEQLVKLLALQVGQMVSINELSQSLGISRSVVQRYIRLLEQSFIIKVIHSFSNNPRTELKKAFKVYFYDNGVRNVLVGMNVPITERTDRGSLFENFFLGERLKAFTLEPFPPEILFWRTRKGLEIDFIEKDGSHITAHECKWTKQEVRFSSFLSSYPNAKANVVTPTDLLN